MATYEIHVTRTAEKQLKKVDPADRERIIGRILALRDDPRPAGCRKLSGYADVFRIRVGAYRVLYSAARSKLIVLILKVAHRRDVYRR